MEQIFSLLFFVGALASIVWGFVIIRLNPKSNINQTYLFICIALSIWSMGFAMSNSESSVEQVLLWRRFSAIGWTSIFSFILHFFLLIANQEYDYKLDKSQYLLYIPAIINLYIFAFSNKMAMVQYNFVKIEYGWTNLAVNNHWDIFFYFYYVSYMLISIIIVWKWGRKTKDKIKARQSKIMLITIVITSIIGGYVDLAANSFLTKPIPQMAPLFIILPVWTMYYSAKQHNILSVKKIKDEELIISSEQEKQIFNSFAIGIVLIGILSFIFEFNSAKSLNIGDGRTSLLKSSLFIVLGISIFLIQRIRKESLREKLTNIILVASIPVVSFQFLNYSAITVWAYSLCIIISSILFNKRVLLISATVVAMITQRLVWILRPEANVIVDRFDFTLRLLIIFVAFLLCRFINKVYIERLKENNYQMAFQNLVSDITLDLVGFTQENSYDKLSHLLEKKGKFFKVDRTYIFTINHNNDTMTYSNEWCDFEIEQEVGTIEDIPIEVFPWWIEQLESKKMVYISDVDDMPKEAKAEQEQLQRQGVKSLISVPITRKGKIHAFIGMDSVIEKKTWSKEHIEMIKIVANILSNVLTPVQIDKETKFRAYNDSLTKLPNRYLFNDKLNHAINLSKRSKEFIAVMFIDLDGFKAVNDTIGHEGGDILLKQVADALSKAIRNTDVVARFGGDEFLIMITNIKDYDEITNIADKIMKIFVDRFKINGNEYIITASAGIATYPFDGEDSNSLIKNADIAMYRAKEEGKNQYILCTKDMREKLIVEMALSNDIYSALRNDEFIVYYQPQIDPLKNKIVGLEALVRWNHPTRGLLSPEVFIPIAEKNNLINSLGEWVLKTACIQIKKWQDIGIPLLKVAINLSAVQIMNPKIVDVINDIIKKTRLDPRYICLEITESIAIKETDYVTDVLNELKKLGVSIAIDDFGTEYSSLTRLKLLPIDLIKIDMQFVQGIECSEKDKAIIMVIISLAHKLNLSVLAEGVETKNQLDFLVQEHCDIVQGYYYYKPMDGTQMEKLLTDLFAVM